ncbi:hypothetical protein [Brumimicrobium mesophilum]|uniref:hypothetical protein n=1 Tax=Brumimicrobium mesophilum TaxID=392717 RepID=UPI000D144540|nr:hypothetical protein [Brumimicrobium mesophilum]
MKQLIWKLILPLTIISFSLFSKWWHIRIDNEFDEIITGFPVPYILPGWHTSLSLQIFVSGFLINILSYFTFWFTAVFIVHHFLKKIRPSRILTTILLSFSLLFLSSIILVASNPDNIYKFQNDNDIEVIDSGYKMIWQNHIISDHHEDEQ